VSRKATTVSASELRGQILRLRGRLLAELRRAQGGLAEEPVHQSRVAARTLRSVLSTLKPLLEPTLSARARRDLRNVALELETIRETDVRRDWLQELVARTDALPPGARERLQRQLESDRRLARLEFRKHAGSEAYLERLERLEAALGDPKLVSGRLTKRWKRLLRSRKAARGADATALHELRLAAKHARYASESLMPMLGLDPRPAVKPVKRLQNCLGDHRDATQALAWLRGLGEPLSPLLVPRLKPAVRKVMAKREKELARLLERIEVPDLRAPPAGEGLRLRRASRRPGGRSPTSSGRRLRRSSAS
jgi:CHAD domain-containing protein